MRTSGKALADYLTKLFGQRPEPWEVRAATDPPPPPEVDYEHTNAKGLVPTPNVDRNEMLARLALRAESPLMQAEAADGEWDEQDEDVKTAGALPSLGQATRNAEQAGSRTPIARRAPSSANDSGSMTLNDMPAQKAVGKARADELTRTEPQQTTPLDTATDLPMASDDATVTVSPATPVPPPPRVGDETGNRTLVEPSTFDAASNRTIAGGHDDEFENEVATEIAQDDDPPWKHHDDAKASAASRPGKGRVSPAVIPRSSLPSAQRPSPTPASAAPSPRPSPLPAAPAHPPRPARPSAPPPPPQRPTPVPAGAASQASQAPMSAPEAPMSAPGPGGPLTLPGHAAPGAPAMLGAAPASFPPLKSSHPVAPLAGRLPPVPFVDPQSPLGIVPAAPAPSLELRGTLRELVEKRRDPDLDRRRRRTRLAGHPRGAGLR